MLIWAANRPERDALVAPDRVEVEPIPAEPLRDPRIGTVEVLVPPYRSRSVLEALPRMSALRLIQTLESGVEWLLPFVPPGSSSATAVVLTTPLSRSGSWERSWRCSGACWSTWTPSGDRKA